MEQIIFIIIGFVAASLAIHQLAPTPTVRGWAMAALGLLAAYWALRVGQTHNLLPK